MKLRRTHYTIAYDHLDGVDETKPCVVFCSGFNSNRQGNKAMALEVFCRQQGLEYIRFDYSAHGESGGEFHQSTISTWRDDTLAVIDELVQNPRIILVGSSMGGWLALLAALARPDRLAGLLLIACAADMTRFYPDRLKHLTVQKANTEHPYYLVPNEYDDQQPYKVYQRLLEDGEQWALLDDVIPISAPVRLVHGLNDEVVGWQRSQAVMQRLSTQNASLALIKNGDHRLSSASDLNMIESALLQLLY